MTLPKIVVGVDGFEHSKAALRWALDHAHLLHACVEAIYAWQFPLLSVPGAFTRDELETLAKQLLLDAVSAVQPPPEVPLRTIVTENDPRSALIEAARDATLLVLGTRGRSPFTGLLLGSVSQTCAAAAPPRRDRQSPPRHSSMTRQSLMPPLVDAPRLPRGDLRQNGHNTHPVRRAGARLGRHHDLGFTTLDR